MKLLKTAPAIAFFLILSACAPKPEGPAEKIGKGLDQILDGSQELNDRYGKDSSDGALSREPTEDEKRAGERDNRHDYHSDAWWREHDRQAQAGQN